ncbi:type II toxin-antitoxin system death-on-curing family toxin [Blastococcus saxobsidens]|uniref:Cytotoxic translational repressor of toxin-antitoxin stability system, Putative toxin of TAS system n=1 Tax=Blastococcus saxobsidens (strain DD2) TaxID=1146883 RepID=H6RSW7_BLASD|nr:type II toxin-antitoxin system death-on-curing family toxin [Blastococcus saxobsidens]CCG03070.1 Cytotoxic translational repressor of toxin-antitoxin stability system, Putative toxin of TAS system [Blastococcus saxobsidens DD2]
MTEYLTADDLLTIAEAAIGGRAKVRDAGLLASAAARPQATVFGDDAYPSVHEKAAALLHGLARNHALVDGNKRTAWASTVAFLHLNSVENRAPQPEAVELVLAVATGRLDDVQEIAERLRSM